jgi:hypothetical protein
VQRSQQESRHGGQVDQPNMARPFGRQAGIDPFGERAPRRPSKRRKLADDLRIHLLPRIGLSSEECA